jgi:carbon storage regulator
MLIITRKIDQTFTVGNVVIKIVDVDRNKVRVGIEAPKDIPIYRDDVKTKK